jgi:hypothetical protein
LARINRELIGKLEALDSPQRVVWNMDSTGIPVYGQQERGACYGQEFSGRVSIPSCWGEDSSRRKQIIRRTGDGGLLYTEWDLEVQNGIPAYAVQPEHPLAWRRRRSRQTASK